MKLPLQITFRNMGSSPMAEEWVRTEAAKLDAYYRQIMGCRVAIEMPHRHHRQGGLYHIRIDLTLPGGELVIKRQPNLKDRAWQEGEVEASKHYEVGTAHKNLRQAIDDAFRAAGRRLQDYARRQGGRTKVHEPIPVAWVSKLLADKGYGFLTTEDGREIYFHRSSVLDRGFDRLGIGSRVTFVEEQGEKGPQASTVRITGKGRIRRSA
jgi:cold shock CspA family protein/ribosome-associated translation inhibitor RaiA